MSGTPRRAETTELRSSSGGGGVARAALLDKLNVEMQVMLGHQTLVLAGVADVLCHGRDCSTPTRVRVRAASQYIGVASGTTLNWARTSSSGSGASDM